MNYLPMFGTQIGTHLFTRFLMSELEQLRIGAKYIRSIEIRLILISDL